jgi:hypothetical protein
MGVEPPSRGISSILRIGSDRIDFAELESKIAQEGLAAEWGRVRPPA